MQPGEASGEADRVRPAEDISRGRLDRIAGFHLRLANAVVHRDYTRTMKSIRLTQTQFAVLELLRSNPGLSQMDLARVMATDRATMMAVVSKLDQRHLLERRPSAADRRRQELNLTVNGVKLLEKAMQAIETHERRVYEALSPAELERLVASLRKIHSS